MTAYIFLGQFLVTCNFLLLFALSSQIFGLVFVERIQGIVAKYKTPRLQRALDWWASK